MGDLSERAAVIAARRQHIRDTARCEDCHTTERECAANRGKDPTAPPWFGCCSRILTTVPCRHRESQEALRVLLDEIEAGGRIRTVAEIDPPPVLGPRPVGIRWLLEQQVWWYPLRRPAVRVASMDKPWRWNVVRFLERRADRYKLMDELDLFTGGLAADMPDDVAGDILREPAVMWLHRQPLVRRLSFCLPHPATRRGRLLAARAIHWHTCPMRQAHPGRLDRCLCVRRDNRVVGAINDPAGLAVGS